MFKYFLSATFILLGTGSFAQMKSKVKAYEPTVLLEISPSANAFKGDLNDSYSKWSSSLYLGVRFYKKQRVNLGASIGFGSVNGQEIIASNQDSDPVSNTFFKTSMLSAQLNANITLFRNDFLNVYIGQGIGFMRFIPKDMQGDELVPQVDTRGFGETYSTNTIFLPTQLGVMYFFKNGFGAGVKGGLINPMTDYIDNISELSSKSGRDNILSVGFSVYAPIEFDHTRKKKKRK